MERRNDAPDSPAFVIHAPCHGSTFAGTDHQGRRGPGGFDAAGRPAEAAIAGLHRHATGVRFPGEENEAGRSTPRGNLIDGANIAQIRTASMTYLHVELAEHGVSTHDKPPYLPRGGI